MPQTIHVEILDDPDSEVEELEEVGHLLTKDAIFGGNDLALFKGQDAAFRFCNSRQNRR